MNRAIAASEDVDAYQDIGADQWVRRRRTCAAVLIVDGDEATVSV